MSIKVGIINLFFLFALIVSIGLIQANEMMAQTFSTLHNFTSHSSGHGNSDGAHPWAGLTLSNETLYGTAEQGGSSGNGSVFKIKTDGTGFTTLHSFTGGSGESPIAKLILSGHSLYGTTYTGGSSGKGTVFKINTDGTGFTNLHSFAATGVSFPYTNSEGAYPVAGLILSGDTLYGTASEGGSFRGTIFSITINGTDFTVLYRFTKILNTTNSDGAYPYAGLVLSGNTLYGTALYGGKSGKGTVFAVTTNGSAFTNLHNFTATYAPYHTNSDGANPYAGLVLAGNALFGTTYRGGIEEAVQAMARYSH